MNIINENDVTLPNNVRKAVESAKNTLTLTEQETKRLIALAKDQEALIKSYVDKKADIEKEVTSIEERLSALKEELESTITTINSRKSDLKKVEAELSSAIELQTSFKEVKDSIKRLINDLD